MKTKQLFEPCVSSLIGGIPHFMDLNRLGSSMNALPHKCLFWNEESEEEEEEEEAVRKMIFIITTTKFSNLIDYVSSPDCSNIGHYALSSARLNVSCKRTSCC